MITHLQANTDIVVVTFTHAHLWRDKHWHVSGMIAVWKSDIDAYRGHISVGEAALKLQLLTPQATDKK